MCFNKLMMMMMMMMIGMWLQRKTNRKSHMHFKLVPISMTLNDHSRPYGIVGFNVPLDTL